MTYEFITPYKLSNLIECAAIVCGMVQSIKFFVPLNPVLLAFISAIFVSAAKLLLDKKFDKQSTILAILNVFPIFLTACGSYDTLKSLFNQE